ncbi:MAG: hypothetical protein ABJA64_00420 [Candidatus Saccharibacteria bacterium]
MTSPTEDEINNAAAIIHQLPRGFLPKQLFYAIAEKTVINTIEMMILRFNKGIIEILLTQRPPDDPYWPNAWHIPGTVLLSTDSEGDYSSAFFRIFDGELAGKVVPLSKPSFVVTKFWDNGRGRELDQVFFVDTLVEDINLDDGRFYSIEELPEGILKAYSYIFPEGLIAYKKLRNIE